MAGRTRYGKQPQEQGQAQGRTETQDTGLRQRIAEIPLPPSAGMQGQGMTQGIPAQAAPAQGMQTQGQSAAEMPQTQTSGALAQPAAPAMTGAERYMQHPAGSVIGPEQVKRARQKLQRYKGGKQSVDRRVRASQQWWKLRNWEQQAVETGKVPGELGPTTNRQPASAWLWNCVVGKHADAMAAFPEPVVLPRMADDKETAQKLSDIIPIVLQQNDFEEVYSDCTWQKMLEGTGCYGVFWDNSKNGGLGDVTIRRVDVLNLFWEPGITDIQASSDLFSCAYVDNDLLKSQYPQMQGKTGVHDTIAAEYQTDDNVDKSQKSLVIDWYYKRRTESGKTVLHYAKLCGDEVLFASEDDPQMRETGFYEDGLYPFVLDRLFPVQGSPCGYGYIDIGKDTQITIDKLNAALTANATMGATPRYFIRQDGQINEEEFSDWTKPLVHVTGNLSTDSLVPMTMPVLNGNAMTQLQYCVEELKFVTGNTDINNGSNPSGVTAASALAALQETAGRTSKDSTKSAYRAYARLVTMVIERIRQFYDVPRTFRILGQSGGEQYVQMGAQEIRPQSQGIDFGIDMGYRLPVFDVEVRAQQENPYTRMSQNELALQLYQQGMFSPQMTDQALMALDMMDFKGKEELMQKIQRNGTLEQAMLQFQGIALQLAQQYEPELAEQLGQIIGMQGGAQPVQSGGDANEDADTRTEEQKRSDTIINKAKERSANTISPA